MIYIRYIIYNMPNTAHLTKNKRRPENTIHKRYLGLINFVSNILTKLTYNKCDHVGLNTCYIVL